VLQSSMLCSVEQDSDFEAFEHKSSLHHQLLCNLYFPLQIFYNFNDPL
jgi:hypothetical protein